MPITLAFDVYGTLIDTHGVVSELEQVVGDKAEAFSHTWRDKQLEYSFRRGLMQQYEDFSVCTSNALDYSCSFYKLPLNKEQKQVLLNSYRILPAFSDVIDGLTRLQSAGFRLFAFSNGSAGAVDKLLVAAGIRELFEGIVSVEDLRSFKPDPAVYKHLLNKAQSQADNTWLISSNSFDVIGAVSAGMRAAWVKRSDDAIFDPWGIEPDLIVENLLELGDNVAVFETADKSVKNN